LPLPLSLQCLVCSRPAAQPPAHRALALASHHSLVTSRYTTWKAPEAQHLHLHLHLHLQP
jgi:hypothetical protein